MMILWTLLHFQQDLLGIQPGRLLEMSIKIKAYNFMKNCRRIENLKPFIRAVIKLSIH